jgi:integrase
MIELVRRKRRVLRWQRGLLPFLRFDNGVSSKCISFLTYELCTVMTQAQAWAAMAANEDFFHLPRARNSPIKSSLAIVDGLPKTLKIYRIAGSRYWQVRVYLLGRYVTQSLKTTDMEEAKSLAHDFWQRQLAARHVVMQPHSSEIHVSSFKLWHDLIQEVLVAERARVERDEIRGNSYVMTQIRLEGLVFEFFKDKQPQQIDVSCLESFVEFLTQKKLAVSTIQGYIAHVRKILKLMYRKNILKSLPSFPSLKSRVTSRGAFTLTEYKKILRMSKQLRGVTYNDWPHSDRHWIKREYHCMPYEMNALIRFMVHTFVRPGDIRQIKNKHIEVVRGGYDYLRLTLPEVKRHNAPTVSLPAAVGIYESLRAYQAVRGYGRAEDYVFFPEEPNRRLALDVAGWAFNWILKITALKKGPHGIDRTLYSLRHTAITFRLIYGGNIDLLTLARNARTSVEMIEKFYASTLSAEMNIALIHGKRHSSIIKP